MTILLVSVVVVLATVNIGQYRLKKRRDVELDALSAKLRRILKQETAEKLLHVTDDKQLQLLLVEINRLLDVTQQNLAQFTRTERSMKKMLANISHDLKTPLTVILGYIEMMQHDHGMAAAERERLLGNVHNKTVEIIKLINTFFDLAKLESGDKEIPLTRVSMNECCKNNMLSFYDTLQAKGFDVAIQIPDVPVYAVANAEALNRVLHNLLSNAIQYGADGKVVGLSLTYDHTHVSVAVWDRGKGIDEREQARVFERMYTLEESRNKTFQGSGLGLTITKKLVEEMGGTITLQSEPYRQTTFTIKLNRLTY